MIRIFQAPAKINLTLEVLSRRESGYHGVRSVIVPLQLSDEITVAAADRFDFSCDAALLDGPDNLVVRALASLGELPSARIELRKHIPVEAGLGGGSSDAATMLLAAMRGAFGAIPAVDWMAIAAGLGSDVPFFLAGTGALVEGIGERVTPLGALPGWHAVIVKPPVGVSTARAYAEIDRTAPQTRPRTTSRSLAMVEAVQRSRFDDVLDLLHNDFQAPVAASVPEVAIALEALHRAGAAKPLLAGSGSSVFTLTKQRAHSDAIARRLNLPETYARFTTAFSISPDWREQ